jgi:tripartite-type tricarboxylate transporter receptor subunit TctC
MARLLAERLQPIWGEQVLVDNRTGGAAVIATEAVVRAAPDGHVLGLLASSFVVTSALRSDLPYDIARDLRAVTHVGSAPALLVARADFPASTPGALIALERTRPGEFSFASPSVNSNGHRAGEAFKRAAGIDLVHVPFKGGAPATAALLGGQVSLMMATPTGFQQHIDSGRLKVLGVSSARRFAANPDAPTFAESGLPGFDMVEWWLLVAPARTPVALIERIHRDVLTAIRQGEFHARMLDLGIETFAAPPPESAVFLEREITRWGRDAKVLGLTP